jgi:hypothetical protein
LNKEKKNGNGDDIDNDDNIDSEDNIDTQDQKNEVTVGNIFFRFLFENS